MFTVNFEVRTVWRLALSGPTETIQAAGKKPIWPIGGPGPARLRLNQACRLGPGKIRENFDMTGPASLKPGLPSPLGALILLLVPKAFALDL